jgi:carboxyl-terminal processing protease
MKIMNNRSFKLFVVAIVLLLSVSFLVVGSRNSNDELRREMLFKVINFAINNGHFNPMELNDSFSERAFDLYIDRIDFSKRFLLQEDVKKLAEYRYQIDNAILNMDFELLDLSVSILDVRTSEAENYFREILKSPFDFGKEEYFEFDSDKIAFAESKKSLKDRWRLSLKYETLNSIYEMVKSQDEASEKSDTVTIKTFAEMEQESREKILKRYEDWFHRIAQINEEDRLNIYINSIVNVYDPHTEYFPPKDKENFDIRFSGQLEGIGAQLTQRNAHIEVTRIIPGSPSWKQGELEVGDLVLNVAQEDEEPVDVVDMRLDDAVLLIRGKKGSKVTLTVKKLDKSIKEITLVRDVVVLEETYARSAIIHDEKSGKNYGYLKLPSFYVDFSQINGRNSFDDVKQEIEKLKMENVAGLVFDLRDNGGGSLEDVVKIAGLFIEQGPIVQASGRKGIKKNYMDDDRQVQFDGPLVVMVNMVSASASEILAAAMQDYGRAIVIGSAHTYGKGTVQNFTELDRMVPKRPSNLQPLGSLKMTVQKFYRINGGATQLNGVTPDIVLPDYYNFIDFGEKDLDHPMPWDEISPLEYTKWTSDYDQEYIINMSRKRILNDSLLTLIYDNGLRLKKIRTDTRIALNYKTHAEMVEKREEEGKKYERIGKDDLGLAIVPLTIDLPEIESDTSKKARVDEWINTLKKDVYLLEAQHILKDIHTYQLANAIKEDN